MQESIKRYRKKDSKIKRMRNYFLPSKGDDFIEIARKIIFDIAFLAIIATTIYLMMTFVLPAIGNWQDKREINALVGNSSGPYVPPEEGQPAPMLTDYNALYAQNPDMVGYLKVPGTSIEYPVVQRTSDTTNEYYLHHNFKGEEENHGALFASYHVNMPTTDDTEFADNTTIYGHHMRDGSMFNPLMDYKDVEFYKQNPVIEFNSMYEKHKWKIFGVVLTSEYGATEPGSLDYMSGTDFANEEQFNKYVSMIQERSMINTTVDVKYGDKIVGLSTCDYTFSQDHGRFVVFARMVREGEDETVDTSTATYNEAAIYPESYYKVKEIPVPENLPYGDINQWQNLGETGSDNTQSNSAEISIPVDNPNASSSTSASSSTPAATTPKSSATPQSSSKSPAPPPSSSTAPPPPPPPQSSSEEPSPISSEEPPPPSSSEEPPPPSSSSEPPPSSDSSSSDGFWGLTS